MINNKQQKWKEANREYLIASIKMVKEELAFYAKQENSFPNKRFQPSEKVSEDLQNAKQKLIKKSALGILTQTFSLSEFERKIILMCMGVELMSEFGTYIAKLQGHTELIHPTFNLAMTHLSGTHWDAISPAANLRKWNLIKTKNGTIIAKSKLMIDEPIMHYLTGFYYLDERLNPIVVPYNSGVSLLPSQQVLVNDILHAIAVKKRTIGSPVIQLEGEENADQVTIATGVSIRAGKKLYRLSVHSIPNSLNDIKFLAQLWNREAILNSYGLFLDSEGLNDKDPVRMQAIINFIDSVLGLLIIGKGDWAYRSNRPVLTFKVLKPTLSEQVAHWNETLGVLAPPIKDYLQTIGGYFNLSAKTISEIGVEIDRLKSNLNVESTDFFDKLKDLIWKTCCKYTRPKVEELAQLLKPVATWDDIILPETQIETLKEIAIQIKNRGKVYEEWGFSKKSSRGFGISALFTGESGTGKTMAAEVLANDLNLDLYRIDLSQVMDKYVGETEKNLKRIFDAAEEGGAILLFDEAESVFGSRGETNDSQGHYINLKIGYLLQRMESYKGLAILTTNMKSSIDKAFLRRIRFVVNFVRPDLAHRANIWKKVFPEQAKLGEINYEKLAQFDLPGGNIKNIAMNAAFRAANEDDSIQMYHLADAITNEYEKTEKVLSRLESRAIRRGVWEGLLKGRNVDFQFLSTLNLTSKDIRNIVKEVKDEVQKETIEMLDIISKLQPFRANFTKDMQESIDKYKF